MLVRRDRVWLWLCVARERGPGVLSESEEASAAGLGVLVGSTSVGRAGEEGYGRRESGLLRAVCGEFGP